MKKAMFHDMLHEIKKSRRRYLSILLIILLGAGFFAGIKVICLDMKISADNYYDNVSFMDYRLISTLGFSKDNIEKIKEETGIDEIMPTVSSDVIVEGEKSEYVLKLSTYPFINNEYNSLNKLEISTGRLPQKDNECVTEEKVLAALNLRVGDSVKISLDSLQDEMKDKFKYSEYVIVGTVKSPMYMSISRGSTTLGNGTVTGFLYIDNLAVDTELYTEVYLTLQDAKALYSFKDEYENLIDDKKEDMEELSDTLKEDRYNEIYEEAKGKIDDAQDELDKAKKDAQKEFINASNKIQQAKNELNSAINTLKANESKATAEFAKAEKEISNAYLMLEDGTRKYEENKIEADKAVKEVNEKEEELNKNKSLIEAGILECDTGLNELDLNLVSIDEKQEQLEKALELAETEEEKLEIQKNLVIISKAREEILKNITHANEKKAELTKNNEDIDKYLNEMVLQVTTINNSLKEASDKLESSRKEINTKNYEFTVYKNNTYNTLNNAKYEIELARNEIYSNEAKLNEEIKNAEEKFTEAQDEINENYAKLADIEKPDIYVLDRNTVESNVGYFEDADKMSAIASVFPIIFFIVAALVSLTSMTRMVEEERSEIGTLKALGYTKFQIMEKYIYYAISASLIGSIIGIIIGVNLLPRIVFNVYTILYDMPELIISYDPTYITLAMVFSCLCTAGATIFSCTKELHSSPAVLMRPKAPKAGKRVLLEKIPFIWNKLNFTQKVTVRNLFRYKKRFLMTLIGIGGCTGLILAGFGLKDSIMDIVPSQYENVFDYDMQIAYKDKKTNEEKESFETSLKEINEIKDYLRLSENSITIKGANPDEKDVNLIVIPSKAEISDYIKFKDRKTQEQYSLEDNGIIITEKIAKLLNINVGDTITLKKDEVEAQVLVSHITENYIMHYVYMSEDLYYSLYDDDINYNVLFVKTDDIDKNKEEEISNKILDNDIVSSVNYISSISSRFADSMNSLNSIVVVLIVSAGLLAFVVLYNLSNVNISERIRELATIKVLGFYDKEVSEYVYRENIILTILGIILGLFIGYFLNSFIITTCEVDMVMFGRNIKFLSYIYSIAITVIFTVFVNILTHFALKKIDMIEALKSVE